MDFASFRAVLVPLRRECDARAMGLRRGALTFTRLFVTGKPPKDLRKRYLDAVRLRGFQALKPEEEASEAVGWCVIERPFDLDFEPDKIFYDRFVLLGLRVDKWRIPGPLLRAQVHDEEQRMLSRAGREKLTRAEREEVKLRVIGRLRRKIPPVSRAFDAFWDLDAGTVLLFTHSTRVIAEFGALFEKTFGFEPVQDSPYVAAKRADLPKALLERLERVEPTSFSQGRKKLAAKASEKKAEPAPAEDDDEMDDVLERIESTRFLGAELLLWVWLRAELVSEKVSLGELGEGEAWLEKKLAFEHVLDKSEKVTIRGVQPTGTSEAREAIRNMKLPVSSRIALRLGDHELGYDLQGLKLAVGSATLPSVVDGEGDDAFLERTALIEQLLTICDGLYFAFLRERLAPLWQEAWQPAIAAWADGEAIPTSALQAITRAGKPPRAAKGSRGGR
jgi:recombination associated protein RdgC